MKKKIVGQLKLFILPIPLRVLKYTEQIKPSNATSYML
jgi:hypothetical protein